MGIFDTLSSFFSSTDNDTDQQTTTSRHHSAAVADGLRHGSSACGRVMASWKSDTRHDDDDD